MVAASSSEKFMFIYKNMWHHIPELRNSIV
jgi:hypothetical protein